MSLAFAIGQVMPVPVAIVMETNLQKTLYTTQGYHEKDKVNRDWYCCASICYIHFIYLRYKKYKYAAFCLENATLNASNRQSS